MKTHHVKNSFCNNKHSVQNHIELDNKEFNLGPVYTKLVTAESTTTIELKPPRLCNGTILLPELLFCHPILYKLIPSLPI